MREPNTSGLTPRVVFGVDKSLPPDFDISEGKDYEKSIPDFGCFALRLIQEDNVVMGFVKAEDICGGNMEGAIADASLEELRASIQNLVEFRRWYFG